jgi:hypothetical protein
MEFIYYLADSKYIHTMSHSLPVYQILQSRKIKEEVRRRERVITAAARNEQPHLHQGPRRRKPGGEGEGVKGRGSTGEGVAHRAAQRPARRRHKGLVVS